jgi:ribosome recycling factor
VVIDDILQRGRRQDGQVGRGRARGVRAIRAGRAPPEHVQQDPRSTTTAPRRPIQQLASFTAPEARIILIQPYDMGAMANIEKAIRDSDLGVNPSNDGKVLRCVFPELTEERRKEYIKVARTKAEDGRLSLRNIRLHAKHRWRSSGRTARSARTDVTGAEKRLEAITKKHTDQIDDLLKHKEAELLEV